MELFERSLIKICLVVFLFTFIFIFYIENNYELEYTDLDSLTIKHLDKNVKVNGIVTHSSNRGNNLFLVIKGHNSDIKGVVFNSNSSLQKGENYSIEGTVKTYKGNIELIVQKIEKKIPQ